MYFIYEPNHQSDCNKLLYILHILRFLFIYNIYIVDEKITKITEKSPNFNWPFPGIITFLKQGMQITQTPLIWFSELYLLLVRLQLQQDWHFPIFLFWKNKRNVKGFILPFFVENGTLLGNHVLKDWISKSDESGRKD